MKKQLVVESLETFIARGGEIKMVAAGKTGLSMSRWEEARARRASRRKAGNPAPSIRSKAKAA